MKKLTRLITIGFVLAALCLSAIGCGSSNGGDGGFTANPSISYSEYSSAGVTFELPSTWEVTQEEDGSLDANRFSVTVVEDLSAFLFSDFCERHVVETLEDLNSQNISYEKKTFGGYEGYEYTCTATIAGESTPIKVLCIYANENALCFMYICNDSSEDYNAIYNHFVDSIN